jgi:hypothetical protein
LKTLKQASVIDVKAIRATAETLELAIPPVQPGELEWARKTAATFDKPNAAPFMAATTGLLSPWIAATPLCVLFWRRHPLNATLPEGAESLSFMPPMSPPA